MAIGDQAKAAGFTLVPDTGDEGRVRWGALEINRTRDIAAQVQTKIPVGKAGFRQAAGISSGTATPSGGNDGDIYFQVI